MSTARCALDHRIDPFDLQLFVAVLERGSITSAVEAMSLSLAGASTRLKLLEHRVGATLLERSKAGAAATYAGQAWARLARRALAERDSLYIEMSTYGHGLPGSVRWLRSWLALTRKAREDVSQACRRARSSPCARAVPVAPLQRPVSPHRAAVMPLAIDSVPGVSPTDSARGSAGPPATARCTA
jgi:molybdenum-dependent DNA-binding transcriptional regulator ModE